MAATNKCLAQKSKSRTGANATTERAVFAALRSPQTEGKCHEYLNEAARDRGAFDRRTNGCSGPSATALPHLRNLPPPRRWTVPRLRLLAGVLRHRQVRRQLEGSRSRERHSSSARSTGQAVIGVGGHPIKQKDPHHETSSQIVRGRDALDRHVDDSRFGSICRNWLANCRVRLANRCRL